MSNEEEIEITNNDHQTWGEAQMLSGAEKIRTEFDWLREGEVVALNPSEATGAAVGAVFEAFQEEVQKNIRGGVPYVIQIEPVYKGNFVEDNVPAKLDYVTVIIRPNEEDVSLGQLKNITAKVKSRIAPQE